MGDDRSLAVALATDLDGHFEWLVLAFQDRLYRFALRLCGSAQDAQEVTQDTFVRAYRALARYPTEQRRSLGLRPWLYRIALNVARNRFRRRRLSLVPLDDVTDGASREPAASAAEQPAAVLEQAERRRGLARLVAALPDRYRAAVILHHVEGLGYGEVASILGQPVGTAKANVHRGIRLLREALSAEAARERDRAEATTQRSSR